MDVIAVGRVIIQSVPFEDAGCYLTRSARSAFANARG